MQHEMLSHEEQSRIAAEQEREAARLRLVKLAERLRQSARG
jgi:hypothetical protein